jgi:hypothetical protein
VIAYTTKSVVNQAPGFFDVLALLDHERVCALRLLCYFRSGLPGRHHFMCCGNVSSTNIMK